MNNKAFLFAISLVLMSFAALIGGLLLVQKLENNITPFASIGEGSTSILQGFITSQELLAYIDTTASFAAYDTIEQLATTTGLQTPCGSIKGPDKENYVLWNTLDNNNDIRCYQQTPIDEYITALMNTNIHERLSTASNHDLPTYNGKYDFFITPKPLTIYGIAQKPLALTLSKLSGAATGLYFFRPSFTIKIPYDLTLYDTLHAFADTVLDTCAALDQTAQQTCIQQALTHFNEKNTNLFPLATQRIDPTHVLFFTRPKTYTNPYQDKQHPLIRFALYIPTKQNQ